MTWYKFASIWPGRKQERRVFHNVVACACQSRCDPPHPSRSPSLSSGSHSPAALCRTALPSRHLCRLGQWTWPRSHWRDRRWHTDRPPGRWPSHRLRHLTPFSLAPTGQAEGHRPPKWFLFRSKSRLGQNSPGWPLEKIHQSCLRRYSAQRRPAAPRRAGRIPERRSRAENPALFRPTAASDRRKRDTRLWCSAVRRRACECPEPLVSSSCLAIRTLAVPTSDRERSCSSACRSPRRTTRWEVPDRHTPTSAGRPLAPENDRRERRSCRLVVARPRRDCEFWGEFREVTKVLVHRAVTSLQLGAVGARSIASYLGWSTRWGKTKDGLANRRPSFRQGIAALKFDPLAMIASIAQNEKRG